jgi:hypothetical protein
MSFGAAVMRRYNWRHPDVATQYSLFPGRREGGGLPEDQAPALDSLMIRAGISPFEPEPRLAIQGRHEI